MNIDHLQAHLLITHSYLLIAYSYLLNVCPYLITCGRISCLCATTKTCVRVHLIFCLAVLFQRTAVQVQKTGVGLPTRAPRWKNGRGDAKTGAGIGWDREVRVALSAVAVADWDLVCYWSYR